MTRELTQLRGTLRHMEIAPDVRFTLEAPETGVAISVRMRCLKGRWIAELSGASAGTAIAPTPRRALAAALEPLGPRAISLLLADLALLEPSVRIAELERAAG